MSQLVAIVKSLRNEEGQDLLEYALLVALIALIAIGAVGAAGGAVNNIFTAIANALSGAASDGRGVGASFGAPRHFTCKCFRGDDPMQSPAAVMTLRQLAGRRFRRSEDGQDLLEYGLLMALIAIFAIGAVSMLGNTINNVFWTTIGNNF